MTCLLHDVAQATSRSEEEFWRLVALLEKWAIGRVHYDPEGGDYPEIVIWGIDPGWKRMGRTQDLRRTNGNDGS